MLRKPTPWLAYERDDRTSPVRIALARHRSRPDLCTLYFERTRDEAARMIRRERRLLAAGPRVSA